MQGKKGPNDLIEKNFKKHVKNKKGKNREGAPIFPGKHIFDIEKDNKSVSSAAESVERAEIPTTSSKSKIYLDRELFVTWLIDSNQKRKPIHNYLDDFINTGLNNMSMRSCLISQQINE